MHGIKSREGRWSVSLCNCSQDTAQFRYGNVILHISVDDLRELGRAMEKIAEGVDKIGNHAIALRKGSVQ